MWTMLSDVTSFPAITEPENDKLDPRCSRSRLDVNDSFFLQGYQLSLKNEEFFAVYRACADSTNVRKFKKKKYETRRLPQYQCGVVGCPLAFDSLWDCDAHYEECHIFQCRECYAILPSGRLLDLHLEEAHDSFFAAAIERGRARYSCLVCNEQFRSDHERHVHLMKDHQYPKWFRFVPRTTTTEELDLKKHKWITNHSKSKKEDSMDDEPSTCTEKQQRREHQKQKRASIPCKFFSSKGGCWRGSKCMFLHATIATTPAATTVDSLADQLSTLSVPDTISFGRKRRL